MFNASTYLLDRQVDAGHGARLALTGSAGDVTYAELHDRVRRLATGLRERGVQPEHRVMMFMADSPWFVAVFLATMRIGAVPVPVSTMMRPDGLAELLRDSRARFLALTAPAGLLHLYDEVGLPAAERRLPGPDAQPPEVEIPKWIEVGPRYGLEVVGPPIPE